MPVVATKSKIRNHSARAGKSSVERSVVKAPSSTDQVVVMDDIPWETYVTLDERNKRRSLRLTYLDGTLEFMTISHLHELIKRNIHQMVVIFCEKQGIDINPQGSTTRKIKNLCAGEADESYCIGKRKKVPDFVLEVELSSGGLDKLQFYKALGVPEVWIWRKKNLDIWQLGQDGYVRSIESRFLPGLNLKLMVELATEETFTKMLREFRKRQFPS